MSKLIVLCTGMVTVYYIIVVFGYCTSIKFLSSVYKIFTMTESSRKMYVGDLHPCHNLGIETVNRIVATMFIQASTIMHAITFYILTTGYRYMQCTAYIC